MEFTIVDQNGKRIDSIILSISISSTGQLQYDVATSNGIAIKQHTFPSKAAIDLMPGILSSLSWAKNYYKDPYLKLIFSS